MARNDEQTNLRMPVDLKTWLQQEADKNRRSLTSEVIVRLEESKQRQETALATS